MPLNSMNRLQTIAIKNVTNMLILANDILVKGIGSNAVELGMSDLVFAVELLNTQVETLKILLECSDRG